MPILEWPGDTRPLWQRALDVRQYELEESTLPPQKVVSIFKPRGRPKVRPALKVAPVSPMKKPVVRPVGPNLIECACGRRAIHVAYGKKLCATCFRIARAGFSVVVGE